MQNYDLYRLGWENRLFTHNRQLLKLTSIKITGRSQTSSNPERLPLFSQLELSVVPWISLAVKSNIDTRNGEKFDRATSLSLFDGRFSKAKLSYSSFLNWNDFLTMQIRNPINRTGKSQRNRLV